MCKMIFEDGGSKLPLSEQFHGADYVGAEDVEGAGDAWTAGGGEGVGGGAADQDGAGAEGEGFDNVAAAADAAVEQHFDLAVHRFDHLGQNGDRRGDAVELAAAVIRYDDGIHTAIDRLARIVRGVHALRDDRTLPRLADPFEIIPADHRLFERRADIRVRHRPVFQHDVRKLHQAAVAQVAVQPARPGEELKEVREHREGRTGDELLHAVAQIALAHAGDRPVDRDDERRTAAALRALDCCQRDVASADDVQLIP